MTTGNLLIVLEVVVPIMSLIGLSLAGWMLAITVR